MYLCYIDESGNTGNNMADENQPYLLLLALLVPPENIKQIENELRELGYKYFTAESRNTDFEFHGDSIYNGNRKRDKYFKTLPLNKRLKILDELMDIAIQNDSIKLGYVAINKSKYYGKLHIQQSAFHLLIEKTENSLEELNSHCLLIADEQDELEQKLIDDLDYFKQHGTTFGNSKIQINRVIDSVHFVQSHNNYLIQLTDVICYITRKGKEAESSLKKSWEKWQIDNSTNIAYIEWQNIYANKGQKYFANAYEKISISKKWLFKKDFP